MRKFMARAVPMWARVNYAISALFGCVLGLGVSVNVNNSSSPSIASGPSEVNMAFEFTLSKAHGYHYRKRKRVRKPYWQPPTPRLKEAEKKPQVIRRPTLPADCTYDSFASMTSSSDRYSCGGVTYQQYEENGVTGYEVVKP